MSDAERRERNRLRSERWRRAHGIGQRRPAQGAFLMRGLAKVRAEISVTALVYNLRRALNILGVARLMAAVAA